MINNISSVVLVHGILNSPNIFKKLAYHLESIGFKVFLPNICPNTGRLGIDKLGNELRQFIDDNIPNSERFYLIGFSMGGLVCRYYLQRLGGIKRVHRFISLSCPHNGSYLAFLWGNMGCKQMRPGSDFLKDLNSDVNLLELVKHISIWTPFDLTILPPKSSILPKGMHIKIPVLFHPLVPRNKRIIEKVTSILSDKVMIINNI